MRRPLPLLLLLTFVFAACASRVTPEAGADPGPPTVEEALTFLEGVNEKLVDLWAETDRIAWVNSTYITEDTNWLAAKSTERSLGLKRDLIQASRRYAQLELPPQAGRQLKIVGLMSRMPAPAAPEQRAEIAKIVTELEATYGQGKICDEKAENCIDLVQASQIMAKSRDYQRLLNTWTGWRTIAPPMRDNYARFVELSNSGARDIGYSDTGNLWRAGYDMTPEEFEAEVERLWDQVKPLYEALHCNVRSKLSKHYGEERVPRTGPIPAHLLGNMWAQEWGNIYPLVEPYAGQPSLDVTASLTKTGWDATKMVKTSEAFFTGLGLKPLPETFWTRSMITKPRDREVVCHASAWDVGSVNDQRIKMCTEVTEEDFNTVHHELGHIYYYMYYYELPALFRYGAHDGFHEGIGDTLVLSITPGYLKNLGLLKRVPDNPKAEINMLMKRALDKIAFLPFGKLIDQWRWQVFDGRITPETYTTSWWKLREQYQGVRAPVERTEADFDPGAKYHIPANVPYTRYFLAHILQFQFHRALCEASGHQGPLHTCSIAGSKAAGEKIAAMLALGRSKPWPDALELITGQRQMDASAVVDYFQPLMDYLAEQNQGETCGWSN